jgi:hypothetical protein
MLVPAEFLTLSSVIKQNYARKFQSGSIHTLSHLQQSFFESSVYGDLSDWNFVTVASASM